MVTMDSAARAIDALLHRGRAEERDGGVWLDDLAASELGSDVFDEWGTPWRAAAEEWEREHDKVEKERDDIAVDRDLAWEVLHDIMHLLDVPMRQGLPVGTPRDLPADVAVEKVRNLLTEWRDEVSNAG